MSTLPDPAWLDLSGGLVGLLASTQSASTAPLTALTLQQTLWLPHMSQWHMQS